MKSCPLSMQKIPVPECCGRLCDAGLYTDGNTNMIVSRGLGNSIIPIRFNNRPEIVLIELQVNNK